MPSPKNGTAGTLVVPSKPAGALIAADDKTGAVPSSASQAKTDGGGKIGSVKVKYTPSPLTPHQPDPEKKGWIEIQMLDEENSPVAGEAFRIVLPDGQTVAEGTLDEKGTARVDGFEPGSCQISFPNLDASAFKSA